MDEKDRAMWRERMELKDGEPCKHPGCLHHVTHPCEGCGRIAGRAAAYLEHDKEG